MATIRSTQAVSACPLNEKKKVVTWQCAQKKALVFGLCLPFVKTIRSLVTHVFFKGETGSDV